MQQHNGFAFAGNAIVHRYALHLHKSGIGVTVLQGQLVYRQVGVPVEIQPAGTGDEYRPAQQAGKADFADPVAQARLFRLRGELFRLVGLFFHGCLVRRTKCGGYTCGQDKSAEGAHCHTGDDRPERLHGIFEGFV